MAIFCQKLLVSVKSTLTFAAASETGHVLSLEFSYNGYKKWWFLASENLKTKIQIKCCENI